MKLKYGSKVDWWYFPVLGGIVKAVILPHLRYGNVFRNIVL